VRKARTHKDVGRKPKTVDSLRRYFPLKRKSCRERESERKNLVPRGGIASISAERERERAKTEKVLARNRGRTKWAERKIDSSRNTQYAESAPEAER
jgi:hypothetical protein